MTASDDLMRRLLFLPDAALDLRGAGRPAALLRHHGDDDRLDHHRPHGVLFFFKYRERRPKQSTPLVVPSVRFEIRRHRRAAVLLPALVRAGLQRLRLVHDAARERDGRLRHGQEVDVEVLLRRRGAERHRDAARAGQPPGAAAHDHPRRHPLVLRARLPHQAGRAPRPLHRDLVRGHQARALSDPLLAVLRHLALADAGRGRGDAGAGVRPVDHRAAAAASPRGPTPAATTARASTARSSSTARRSPWTRGASSATRSTASRTSARPGSTSTASRSPSRTARP